MKEIILIKNNESDLLWFYLNLYALKIKKTDNRINYLILNKEEANKYIELYNLIEFPVLLMIDNDKLVEKYSGFGFLNKLPVF